METITIFEKLHSFKIPFDDNHIHWKILPSLGKILNLKDNTKKIHQLKVYLISFLSYPSN